jgi:hypothetical protein
VVPGVVKTSPTRQAENDIDSTEKGRGDIVTFIEGGGVGGSALGFFRQNELEDVEALALALSATRFA